MLIRSSLHRGRCILRVGGDVTAQGTGCACQLPPAATSCHHLKHSTAQHDTDAGTRSRRSHRPPAGCNSFLCCTYSGSNSNSRNLLLLEAESLRIYKSRLISCFCTSLDLYRLIPVGIQIGILCNTNARHTAAKRSSSRGAPLQAHLSL